MESRYGIGINNRYAFFLDEDGDVDPELMLAKKKAMDNAKTPVAAPELDTKPVKKADTPAAEKKTRNQRIQAR